MPKFLSLIALIIILSAFSGACSNEMNVWILGMQTTVYNELQVTEQWQEVGLLKQLSSDGPIHHIILKLENEDNWQFLGEKELKNPQGQLMNIEVQLIDENGLTYELKPNFYNRWYAKFWINYERVTGGEEFPKPISGKPVGDVIFTKLRIRSNHSFTCTKIIWERYHL